MDVYEKIVNLRKANLPGVLVTVIDKQGHGPQIPGAKMLITSDKKTYGTIGGGALEYAAIEELAEVIKKQSSYTKKYNLDESGKLQDGLKTGMLCGGEITLFYECLKTKPSVFIFGAGHVGQSVAYFLKPLEYKITVIDARENIGHEFGEDITFINKKCEDVIEKTVLPTNSFVVITTHSHDLDYKVLKKVYESDWNPYYIGLIASKKKSVNMIGKLADELKNKPDLSILYSPIGLKTGGSTPADIGISIASEIQVLRYKVEGNKHSSKNWAAGIGVEK